MPDVYEGDNPYIFACYAHADRDAVLPMIGALVADGYRVWWDDGIELATRYPQRIADHVYGCARFVMFVSRASVDSDWCADETHYALDLKKTVLPVYLEDVELTRDLQMRMGRIQSLRRSDYGSDEALCRRLRGERTLGCCLTNEGRRRKGAKPRGAVTGIGGHTTMRERIVVADESNGMPGVARKEKLADYSWAELKELSRMIAAARSDAEGLGIAKAYRLVDRDGRLQGDAKEVALGDRGKTRTSVRILGFRHDELASGGRAGISFEFADVPVTHRMNPKRTNAGGWEGSEMRKWLNSSFLGLLPSDLRASVAEARKRTNNRGLVRRENDTACVTATDDRLWLLSMFEVYGGVSLWVYLPASYGAEGTQYRLYADKGVSTENYGFCRKEKDGADSWWWLRSPYPGNSRGFHGVCFDGNSDADYADSGGGVSPGFCL